MASIDLTTPELQLVLEVLESAYRDLKEEIYKTEDHAFKQQLKEREGLFQAMVEKFRLAGGR
jgi:hypothetical protein